MRSWQTAHNSPELLVLEPWLDEVEEENASEELLLDKDDEGDEAEEENASEELKPREEEEDDEDEDDDEDETVRQQQVALWIVQPIRSPP